MSISDENPSIGDELKIHGADDLFALHSLMHKLSVFPVVLQDKAPSSASCAAALVTEVLTNSSAERDYR